MYINIKKRNKKEHAVSRDSARSILAMLHCDTLHILDRITHLHCGEADYWGLLQLQANCHMRVLFAGCDVMNRSAVVTLNNATSDLQ